MPVILSEAERDLWMNAPWSAKALQGHYRTAC
jgi:hypothetical protein